MTKIIDTRKDYLNEYTIYNVDNTTIDQIANDIYLELQENLYAFGDKDNDNHFAISEVHEIEPITLEAVKEVLYHYETYYKAHLNWNDHRPDRFIFAQDVQGKWYDYGEYDHGVKYDSTTIFRYVQSFLMRNIQDYNLTPAHVVYLYLDFSNKDRPGEENLFDADIVEQTKRTLQHKYDVFKQKLVDAPDADKALILKSIKKLEKLLDNTF